MAWSVIANIKGEKGSPGDTGTPGLSVASATIDESGHLILTMSDSSTIDAGTAKGAPGGGVDFETSVQSVADLPTSDPYQTARYVRDDGHLYVYEPGENRPESVDGWTDVGPIRGEQGDRGADGANGVSVTGANVNGAYELVLTLSSGSTVNAGNVRGPAGSNGADGTDGAKGDTGAKGDKGDTGDAGEPGARGSLWFAGTSGPVGIPNVRVGDMYLEENGVVWRYEAD